MAHHYTLADTAPIPNHPSAVSSPDDARESLVDQGPVNMPDKHPAYTPMLNLRGGGERAQGPCLLSAPQTTSNFGSTDSPQQSKMSAPNDVAGPEDLLGETLGSATTRAREKAPRVSCQEKGGRTQATSSAASHGSKPVDLTVDLTDLSDDRIFDILMLNPTIATQFQKACAARLQQHQQSLNRAYDERLVELEDYTRKWRETTKELWVQLKWAPVGDASQQAILAWNGPQYMGARYQRYPLRSQATLRSQLPTIDLMTGEPRIPRPVPVPFVPRRHSPSPVRVDSTQADSTLIEGESPVLQGDIAANNSILGARALTLSPPSPQLRWRPRRAATPYYERHETAPSTPTSDAAQFAVAQPARNSERLPFAASHTDPTPVFLREGEPTAYERTLALHKEFRKSGLTILPKTSTSGIPSPQLSRPASSPGAAVPDGASVAVNKGNKTTATGVMVVNDETKSEHREVIVIDDSSDEDDGGRGDLTIVDSNSEKDTSKSRKSALDGAAQSTANTPLDLARPASSYQPIIPGAIDGGAVQGNRAASEQPVALRPATTENKTQPQATSVDAASTRPKYPDLVRLAESPSIRDSSSDFPSSSYITAPEEEDTEMVQDQGPNISGTQEIERAIEEQLLGTREVGHSVELQLDSAMSGTDAEPASILRSARSDDEEHVQMTAAAAALPLVHCLRGAPEQKKTEKSPDEFQAELVLQMQRDRELAKNAAKLDAE